MTTHDFRDRFAIAGIGITPTSRSHAPGMSAMMLEAWAARIAIADAGLTRTDIDGAVHTMMGSPHPPAQWRDAYTRTLGLKPNFYLTVSRGGQAAHNGILLATQALALGLAEYVIVSCGLAGWSTSHQTAARSVPGAGTIGLSFAGIKQFGLGNVGFDGAPAGAAIHGMMATRHMHEYGTTVEQLASVSIGRRKWAQLNPDARFYGRPADLGDYLAEPWVARPLRRMDCCVQSDLGAALVLTTSERAKSLRNPPVYIKGIGLGDHARAGWWDKTNYTTVDAAFAADHAFRLAGVTLDDIDVAELYDCFSTEVLIYMEDYGWCAKGEGGAFVASGATDPGGSIPVNTHGGLLSGMYLFDYPGVVEAVCQLRGHGGARQVAGAQIALTNGHGGEMVSPQMCAAHATMILGSVTS
jgi:acetyl-CoA acetyltransferase